MRKETITISERNLMFCVGGQLFSQAPNRQPRKAEIIMQKIKENFRKEAYNDNEYYTIMVSEEDRGVYKYIDKLLKNIPEFVELNLSQIEFDKNISVDDENRPKFSFSTRYDKYDAESWKSDFIDLDAFIGNVVRNIYTMIESGIDCFCCIHGNSDKCTECIVNPKYKINYECGREPKGEYTFACKFDCYKHRYICCEECSDKNSCVKKCDCNSKECGLVINKITK
ncbi:hypothetical protein LF65_02258 [Clostridium beijerinckii]|uniref:Uncharacterized protein n=1 Tax=Clostridium beijerinckii TaxID=1520 RepID=A0A0B5Q9D6_CLOBE|nr:hypothetical protein [Clostridium beijerinckii]AJG98844.1 hypothetical protein LF65_02258 [Clostridium beijerinckii]